MKRLEDLKVGDTVWEITQYRGIPEEHQVSRITEKVIFCRCSWGERRFIKSYLKEKLLHLDRESLGQAMIDRFNRMIAASQSTIDSCTRGKAKYLKELLELKV